MDGLVVVRQSLLVLTEHVVSSTPVVVGKGIVWVKLYGVVQVLSGLLVLVELVVRKTTVVVVDRITRV